MLCFAHMQDGLGSTVEFHDSKIVELRPDLVGLKNPPGLASSPAADIVWVNRGSFSNDTDGFNAVFGLGANLARGVIDAVITSYERMIGSFNYGDNSPNYNLTLSMSGATLGATASLQTSLGGKPKSGTITMGSGTDGHGAGWFLDASPFESSEFAGNIVNAFAGDAQSGSPAFNKADFFTIAAAEMTHCMGQFGNLLASWANLTADTGLHDNATGVGNLWVFRGPSIKHLMTSDNLGQQDYGSAIHTSEPSNFGIDFQGDNYWGAEDQGNAFYEFGRRYLVDYTSALMFRDAYGYSSVNPASFEGTFYSNLNPLTKILTVRGGDFVTGLENSNDTISVSRNGNIITVSVDAGKDAPGTGALPGLGNLPAWETQYDASQIDTINIDAGAGDDTVEIGSTVGKTFNVDGNTGTDTVIFDQPAANSLMRAYFNQFFSETTGVNFSNFEGARMYGNANPATWLVGDSVAGCPILVIGGSSNDNFRLENASGSLYQAPITIDDIAGGNDTLTIDDSASAGQFFGTVYTTTAARQILENNGFAGVSYHNIEKITIKGDQGFDQFVLTTVPGTPIYVDGGPTGDLYFAVEGPASAPVVLLSPAGGDSLLVNNDNTGTAFARVDSTMGINGIQIGDGGELDLLADANITLVTNNISIGAQGRLNLNNNDFIAQYNPPTPIAAFQSLVSSARAGGTWGGYGITSFTARDNPQHNTTLGIMESTEYKSIYGQNATFNGLTINDTSILIKYTLAGDANFDERVNVNDFTILASNFGQSNRTFSQGDFNYDGTVNVNDFSILASCFGTVLAADDSIQGTGERLNAPKSLFGTSAIADTRSEDDRLFGMLA